MELVDQIRSALYAKRQTTSGCCIATNPLIGKLRAHGTPLLAAFEAVVQELPESQDSTGIFGWRANFSELFTIYFEIAQDRDYDCAPFVSNLSEAQFAYAKRGIRDVWGTNNDQRRTVMSKPLFAVLAARLSEGDSLLVVLNRLVRIGQLSFDRNNPGKRAPRRFA